MRDQKKRLAAENMSADVHAESMRTLSDLLDSIPEAPVSFERPKTTEEIFAEREARQREIVRAKLRAAFGGGK